MTRWVCMSLCIIVSASAPAQAGTVWLHGTNAWGGGGIYHVDSALAPTPGELAVSVGASGFAGTGVFLPNDVNGGFNAGVHVAFTPIAGIQVGLGGSYLLNNYTTFATSTVQAVGNPEAHVKGGYELAPGYAVGLAAHAALATYAKSALSAWPLVARFLALGSAQPLPFLQINAQAGYALDRSAAAYSPAPEDPVRLALGVSDRSHVDFGVGVVGRIRAVFLAPFVEFSGAVPLGAARPAWVAVVTPGVRLDRSYGGIFEVGAGVDLRVAGAPQAGDTFAGAPAWRAFVQLTVHGLTSQAGALEWNQRDCAQDDDCPAEAMCREALCVQRPPPPPPPPPQKAVRTVRGVVLDAATRKPVANAHIVLLDYPQAPLHGDAAGRFASFPLPDDGKPVALQVRAYGYVEQRLEVAASPGGEGRAEGRAEGTELEIMLAPEARATTGSVHLFVRDGRSGDVVPGAKVVAAGQTASTDAQGECILRLEPGMVHVVTNAEHYVQQNAQIEVQVGATVILNIDLAPQHRPAPPARRRR